MKKNIWSQITEHLNDDERLVWPRMYFENRQLYDQVKGVVYIVRYVNETTGEIYFDWVKSDHDFRRQDPSAPGRVCPKCPVDIGWDNGDCGFCH